MYSRPLGSTLVALSLGLAGCGGEDEKPAPPPPAGTVGSPCDMTKDTCNDGLACEEAADGSHRCATALYLQGIVKDASTGDPIEGARVMAVDDKGFPVTDVATSDAKGAYELAVPAPRDADGAPVSAKFTLRAAAQDYQAFPNGPRVALPIDVKDAAEHDGRLEVESTLTTVELIPLPDGGRSKIEGTLLALASHTDAPVGGVLVVATGAGGAVSGLSDKAGAFTIFNVPPGDQELKGYGAGLQLESKSVTVEDEPLTGVELHELGDATTTVSGSVQLVNAPGGSLTSVILVVEDTFDANVARGEAPRGLRSPASGAPNVSGAFTIEGVPAGKYVVLAAYENDALVRDPDTNIAGTEFVHLEVTVGEATTTIDQSFKVTGALAVVSPGKDAPEAVDAAPDLVWADDSSEDGYDLRVFDAFGNEVWQSLELPAVKGSANVTVKYEGPLDPGIYYQFRVSSWRQPGKGDRAPISATEDLRGVFYLPTP